MRRRARRARDTIGDFRNARSSQDFLPSHWVAGNVHSQGSKSFPRCIRRLAGRGSPVEGTKELTFRDRSSCAAVWSSLLPGWELVVKSRQCPPYPLPTTMQKLTACAILQTPECPEVRGERLSLLKSWSFLELAITAAFVGKTGGQAGR